jgi:hypothetical protein
MPRAKYSQKATGKKRADYQSGKDSFEAVAKRLGADEDKARFEAKLGKIARAKPKVRPK